MRSVATNIDLGPIDSIFTGYIGFALYRNWRIIRERGEAGTQALHMMLRAAVFSVFGILSIVSVSVNENLFGTLIITLQNIFHIHFRRLRATAKHVRRSEYVIFCHI